MRHLLLRVQSYHLDPLHPHEYQVQTQIEHTVSAVCQIFQLCTFLCKVTQAHTISIFNKQSKWLINSILTTLHVHTVTLTDNE